MNKLYVSRVVRGFLTSDMTTTTELTEAHFLPLQELHAFATEAAKKLKITVTICKLKPVLTEVTKIKGR